MEPVTSDQVLRTCAVQAVRIETLVYEKAQLAGELAAAQEAARAADAEVGRLRAELEARAAAAPASP